VPGLVTCVSHLTSASRPGDMGFYLPLLMPPGPAVPEAASPAQVARPYVRTVSEAVPVIVPDSVNRSARGSSLAPRSAMAAARLSWLSLINIRRPAEEAKM
jgi:hypothetical protein